MAAKKFGERKAKDYPKKIFRPVKFAGRSDLFWGYLGYNSICNLVVINGIMDGFQYLDIM